MTQDRNVHVAIHFGFYPSNTERYLFKIEILFLFINKDICISQQKQKNLFEIQMSIIQTQIYVFEIEISLLYVEIEKYHTR